jgi:hypothetical protein
MSCKSLFGGSWSYTVGASEAFRTVSEGSNSAKSVCELLSTPVGFERAKNQGLSIFLRFPFLPVVFNYTAD